MEQDLLLWLNHDVASPGLDRVMVAVSSLGYWLPVLVAVAVWLVWRFRGRGFAVVVAMGLAVAITDPLLGYGLKPLFARPRPCHEMAGLLRLMDGCGGPYGFPSNHAANAAAMVAALGAAFPRTLLVGIPLALAVGVSRIYLCAHYPTDVLAGYVVGALVGVLVFGMVGRLSQR